jgi:Tat protein secretion system quality control protein TatD with DNase activity
MIIAPLLRRLVLETDAPALGPDKAGINVPANISISCAEVRIAESRNMRLVDI